MSAHPIRLADPGNPNAQKALRKYEHGRKPQRTDTSLTFLSGSGAFFWIMIMPGTAKLIMGGFFAVFTGAAAAITWSRRRRERLYLQHVNTGGILTLDPHLIAVWDELFAEAGHKIDCCQRRQHLSELFYAARDLVPDLATRTQAHAQQDHDAELRAEARIRVRLLQEARPILAELTARSETQKQIAALSPDWADAGEVEQQLELLRQRHATHTAQAPDGDQPPPA